METNSDIVKICHIGKTIRRLLWVICGFILLSNIGFFLLFDINIELFSEASAFGFHIMFDELIFSGDNLYPEEISINDSPNTLVKWLFYISTPACLIIAVFIILRLDKLFKSYSNGIVFHPDNTKGFSIIGWLLIGLYFTDAITSMTLDTLLFQALPPELVVSEEISDILPIESMTLIYSNATLLLFGSFLVVVARVMSYAENLKKEIDTLI